MQISRALGLFSRKAWAMIISSPLVFLMASKPYPELLRTTPSTSWLEILYLAVFNSIAGNVLWTYGTRHLPADPDRSRRQRPADVRVEGSA